LLFLSERPILALLFVIFLIVFGICIIYWHVYIDWSVTMWVISSLLSLFGMTWVYRNYKTFVKNRVVSSCRNLSIYDSMEFMTTKEVETYLVYKKCDTNINKYYWKVKTADGDWFYTDCCAEAKTLRNILRVAKISELRGKSVDDFFEYCLISYIAREDEANLRLLSMGSGVQVDGLIIKTEDFFNRNNSKIEKKKKLAEDTTPTPDVFLQTDTKPIIIDAYNGAGAKKIMDKIKKYKAAWESADVYVFSSGVQSLGQLMSQIDRKPFRFYTLDGSELKEVKKIVIGLRTISILELNEQYFEAYATFTRENAYWQHCEASGKIEKTATRFSSP